MEKLNKKIVRCKKCPRLIGHIREVARVKRKSYKDWKYWGKPVPNFGDNRAQLLILGLAPAAHGANRTGRMFTGDRSGDWLYRALHKAGFANQALSSDSDDGLKLKNANITAVCHCAPPLNKPSSEEVANCQPFLIETFDALPVKVVLALGSLAWTAAFREFQNRGWIDEKRPKFGHCSEYALNNGITIVGSYHPSQQNTFTGRLTEPMFDRVFRRINQLL